MCSPRRRGSDQHGAQLLALRRGEIERRHGLEMGGESSGDSVKSAGSALLAASRRASCRDEERRIGERRADRQRTAGGLEARRKRRWPPAAAAPPVRPAWRLAARAAEQRIAAGRRTPGCNDGAASRRLWRGRARRSGARARRGAPACRAARPRSRAPRADRPAGAAAATAAARPRDRRSDRARRGLVPPAGGRSAGAAGADQRQRRVDRPKGGVAAGLVAVEAEIGSSAMLHSRLHCSAVSAVPSGATVCGNPAEVMAMTSI